MDMPPSFTCSCYHLLILVCKNRLNIRQEPNVDCVSISSWNSTVELMFRPSSRSYRSIMTFASVEALWAYRALPDSKMPLQLQDLPGPCFTSIPSFRLPITTVLRNPEAGLSHCWHYFDWSNPNADLFWSWEGRKDVVMAKGSPEMRPRIKGLAESRRTEVVVADDQSCQS